MKFLIFLFLFNIYNTQADENIIIELTNVTGQYESGVVPDIIWPLSDEDIIETENLKLLLELARRMAPVGVHELPPFDPYTGTDRKDVSIEGLPDVKGDIDMSNLVLTGLSAYEFSDVAVQSNDTGEKVIEYVVSVPTLSIEGDVKVKLSVGGGKPERLSATISGVADGITSNTSIAIAPKLLGEWDTSFGVEGMQVESHIDSMRIVISNIKLIDERRRDLVDQNTESPLGDMITAIASILVKEHLNEILGGMTTNQVNAFLSPKLLD